MQRVVRLLTVLVVAAAAATNPAAAAAETADTDTCWATGDVNGNTIAFEIADWVYLTNFVGGQGPPPDPLYEGDLNADGFIDQGDVTIIWLVIISELEVEVPILTVCNPDTIRGACWKDGSCTILSPANCAAAGGSYLGNETSCACDCGVWGDVTGDGDVNPQDVTYVVQLVYYQNDMRVQLPACPYEAGDVDCDAAVNPQDVTLYVQYVYYTNDLFCDDPCGE